MRRTLDTNSCNYIITNNAREFQRVPSLALDIW